MTNEELNETILTYNNYLDRMHLALQHFCEDLQESNFREINPAAPAIINGFEWIDEASQGFVAHGALEETKCNLFREFMGKILEAMENKDYVFLHDIMEFDLLPLITELKIGVH